MDIDFYDKHSVVYRPPRRLNPERLKIANQIFDELIESGFATESNGRFSSPVVLVVYPDHRKPRLTGDFSGPNGVNANTIPIAPNLPKISDVLEFLSQANYIGTLDLPKAFWQLKINEGDIEKTTLSIPGHSISFNRACFGLKNVPAVFQNVMSTPLNPERLNIANQVFDELIESGFATTSNGRFSSPVVLVVYPDHRKPHLTDNFSGPNGVNANTIPITPNLSKISDLITLEHLISQKHFGNSKSTKETSRKIPSAFLVAASASTGRVSVSKTSPQCFKCCIFSIEGVFIYIDDIIIIGNTLPEFIDRLKTVLLRAKEKRVSLGLPKCHFKSKDHEIKILGSIFVNGTRQIDPSRLTGLIQLPAPKTVKDVRSFVGSINYIRDWLPSVSEIIFPIIELTREDPRRGS
ncbi:hypothetical protein P9112_011923 [Eukaryota sp. TZLM1-RC]